MRKTNLLCYIFGLVIAVAFAACESAETREKLAEARPGDTIVINSNTKVYLDLLENGTQSGMSTGNGWLTAEGVFITETPDLSADDPTSTVKTTTKVGGVSRSDGRVLKDTIYCGAEFIDVAFTLAGEPTTTDLTSNDSIGNKTVQVYTGTDGQELTLEDLWRYVLVGVTEAVPHVEPTSSIAGVRYESTADPDLRVVWVKASVNQTSVEGTRRSSAMTQAYETGYYQKKAAAVEPEDPDPLKIKMNILEMFRTYRKNTQHSIMDLWMSFTVVNAKTGETTDEVETDSRMAAKVGHFGAPSYGYSLEEKRLIGSAPTTVEEELDSDNEEAKNASKQIGKFNFQVDCYKQSYYVHFPVMGRPDSEGGKEAGGERLLFQLNGSYVDPGMDYTFNFQITHKTDVVIKGWQEITPSYQRPDDPGIHYEYLSSYVVEFIDHFYLNGEEIVWVDSDEGVFYYLVPSQNSKNIEVQNPDYELYYTGNDAHPFHTSTMVVDGWKPIME